MLALRATTARMYQAPTMAGKCCVRASCAPLCFILFVNLVGRSHYYACLVIEEETEAWRVIENSTENEAWLAFLSAGDGD